MAPLTPILRAFRSELLPSSNAGAGPAGSCRFPWWGSGTQLNPCCLSG